MKHKKGFTLSELLIVVAIVAVLAAVAVPMFSGQLEAARRAVDDANARAALSVASANFQTHGCVVSGCGGKACIHNGIFDLDSGTVLSDETFPTAGYNLATVPDPQGVKLYPPGSAVIWVAPSASGGIKYEWMRIMI